jgi:hypothetical protein
MSDTNNSLEEYIARELHKIDGIARRTRASGASLEIGDIYSKDWFFECKIKHNHENIIADRDKEIIDLNNKIPINTKKETAFAYENKFGERYILLEAETFFRLLKKIKESE